MYEHSHKVADTPLSNACLVQHHVEEEDYIMVYNIPSIGKTPLEHKIGSNRYSTFSGLLQCFVWYQCCQRKLHAWIHVLTPVMTSHVVS